MEQTLTLRISTRDDFAAIDALLARAYPRLLKHDYPPSVLVTALPIISRARPELVASGTYFVAEAGGEVVGAGGWTRSGARSVVGDMRHFVTDDRSQRRGIGRAIMGRVIGDAAAAGVARLDCLATRTAVPFYLAMGFVVVGPREVTLRPGITFPSIQMNRRV
ncbi:MAG: GNAT family N-acetyltransferase [Deltaproteobacteria bacterium]|nr:GNAT family N-acetyltransferase [Deltaproteobacteria bacterium]